MPIRFFVSPHYREKKLHTHIELLFPFWGIAAKESMPYVRKAVMQYQYSKNDFTLVDDISQADYVLMPYGYGRLLEVNPAKVRRIIEDAMRAKKKLLIDGSGDLELPINIPHAVILRVSRYRYNVRPNEITVPFPAEDLLESYYDGQLQVRGKSEVPSVSFTGWGKLSLKMRLKTHLKELPITAAALVEKKRRAEHKGLFFRERALAALQSTSGVDARISVLPSYSGHVKTMLGSVEDNRRAFVENLMDADYALCVRGDANASVRFYEALSLGKIPLFLDTACVLPLEDRIDYRAFSVFVDHAETARIGLKLREFHERCTPEYFEEMQRLARDTYRSYLRTDAFSSNLADLLRKQLTV